MEDNSKRVVITGLGVVSPLGIGKDNYWKSLVSGVSGVAPISLFDASEYPSRIAAEVKNFQSENWISNKEARKMDRFTQFAVSASKLAIEDSGIDLEEVDRDRAGVIVGSGIGGLSTLEAQHIVLLEKGPERVSPFLVPMMIPDLGAGQISIMLGLRGPNSCIVTACATGTHSIGDAFEIIKRGSADLCLAGGAEAPVTPLGVAGFSSMRALSRRNDEPEKASRPFDRDRDGFVIGEGAGIVVLERLNHALARGARIYSEIVGYGMSGDAYHITSPVESGDGAIRAMRAALNEASMPPEKVGYINAHGTSTQYNDEIESRAIKKVFGSHAYDLVVSSTKSMTGHLLGAAGGIEAVACAMTILKGLIPPTINLDNPGEDCDLNYAPHKAIEREVDVALSNSFGFGGHNATLLMKKYG